ncbi:unnamed protein product, partial [Rotaria socialis]
DMHHVYEDTFKSTPAMYTNLIVGNRNRRQASDELIHKRPTQTFLLNHITQRQQKKKNKRIQKQQTIRQTSTA